MHLILSYILASLSMSSTRKATWPSIWWLTRSSRGWGTPWCCIPVSAPSGGACRHQSRPVSVINHTQISAWSWCTTLLQYADVMFGPNNQNITSVQYLNMLQDAKLIFIQNTFLVNEQYQSIKLSQLVYRMLTNS